MSDRTEAPTPRRLEEAREEGRVARSLELNSAVVLLLGGLLLSGPGSKLASAFQELIRSSLLMAADTNVTTTWLREMGFQIIVQVLPGLSAIVIGILAAGIITTGAQTGLLWSSKRIGPDLKRLNPLSGLSRVFSIQGLVEMLRALLKLLLIGWVVYSYLRGAAPELMVIGQTGVTSGARRLAEMVGALTLRVGGAYLVLAAADYGYQRWQWLQKLRMTKDEIKEEVRRSEGDPQLKSRVRSQQRRLARTRMMANVPKASVVVVNPTHLAVAIEYQPGMSAPRVLAKGAHNMAERIVALARQHGIPIEQNIPLARSLYKSVEVGQEIPPDFYLAMAEVLARVYKLRGTPAGIQTNAPDYSNGEG